MSYRKNTIEEEFKFEIELAEGKVGLLDNPRPLIS
jgi:hypothetical protein